MNNYGVALLEYCEEFDSYVFFTHGGFLTRKEAEEMIQTSPYGGYLVQYVPTVFRGVNTHTFIKVQ